MTNFNINDSLGYYFIKGYVLFREFLNKRLKEHGLSINSDHWTVLVVIHNQPGISQTVISKYSFRDKSTITRMLDYLEKGELIIRKNAKNDRRSFNIFLTEKGEVLYQKAHRIAQEIDVLALSEIDIKEVEKFKEIFRTTISNLK